MILYTEGARVTCIVKLFMMLKTRVNVFIKTKRCLKQMTFCILCARVVNNFVHIVS